MEFKENPEDPVLKNLSREMEKEFREGNRVYERVRVRDFFLRSGSSVNERVRTSSRKGTSRRRGSRVYEAFECENKVIAVGNLLKKRILFKERTPCLITSLRVEGRLLR